MKNKDITGISWLKNTWIMTVTRWILIRWFYSSSHMLPFISLASLSLLSAGGSGSDGSSLHSPRPCFHRRVMQRDARGVISAGRWCLRWVRSDECLTGCVRARLEGILLLIDSYFRMAEHGQCSAVFLNSDQKKTAVLRSLPKPKDRLFSGIWPN